MLLSLVYHHFFLLLERSFLEINAKGGEILEESEIDMWMERGKGEAYKIFFNFSV
jgi:hypothetical protein